MSQLAHRKETLLMEAWDKRLVEEYNELYLRLERLTKVIESYRETFDTPKELLYQQKVWMGQYLDVLAERLLILVEKGKISIDDIISTRREEFVKDIINIHKERGFTVKHIGTLKKECADCDLKKDCDDFFAQIDKMTK